MRDLHFNPDLFLNYMSGTVLDELLCSYKGLPKGVIYMIIGDPSVGKTTIILDLLSNIRSNTLGARVLFISAEMYEIDLAIYVQRFPKFQDLDILFIEASFDEEAASHHLDTVRSVLNLGWDIVAIDSFYEFQGIIKEEENLTCKKAENVELPRNAGLLSSSFDRFSGKARESMEVKASMAEPKLVSKKLEAYLVDSRSAMAIAPYSDELQ